jgi:exosortase family protein XrtF
MQLQMKISALIKNPIALFLIKIFGLYLLWYIVYQFYIHPNQTADLFVVDVSIALSKWILELFGFAVFVGAERTFGVDGTGGLWVGDNCNGIALFALFAGFIIAFKGKPIYKLIYIIIGILIIELLNVFRLVALAIIETVSRTWTEFNHTYTFTIIIYAAIFLMWIYWVNHFSEKGINAKEETHH